MHDRRYRFIDPFSDRLPRLSRARRREILRLSRLAGGDLFSNARFARFARVRHATSRDPHFDSGVPSPLGSASANRAVDDADLAVRFGNRSACLPHALPVVPTGAGPVSTSMSCTGQKVDV